MASSTRSRKTRKSRANAHMPGAARVRPRIQHVLSPKVQTNNDANNNNNNLVTPHVPSIATETSKSIPVVSPESLTVSQVKGDDEINKVTSILSQVGEPSSASASLHTIQQQEQHNTTIDPLNSITNNNNSNEKAESSCTTETAKPSLESQPYNSTLHLQNNTEAENKCHDANISNDSDHNKANKSNDKHESVNVSPENKVSEATNTELVTKLPISNKRVMTAIKAQKSKLHPVHITNTQQQQHHNTLNAFHETTNKDSQTRVTDNTSKVIIDKKEENVKSIQKGKCEEDVYANAQTIEIEIPPAPPSLQSSVTNAMLHQKQNNTANVELHNVVENGKTNSSSNITNSENDAAKSNMEVRQGTSTTPMTHTNITSVPLHLTDTNAVNTISVEKNISSVANTHTKHNSEAEHVTDEHSVKSLQKEHHDQHQQKERNQKRMMRKRGNASKMKRGNSYSKENIATASTSTYNNYVSVSGDKPVNENNTFNEQETQEIASQTLANDDNQTVKISEQSLQNEFWQSQYDNSNKINIVTPANTDTIQTEFSKTPNVKVGNINKKVKIKLTLLDDINKETNPVHSSSAADVTHARATISKTNLLKKRKLFPQQTEVNNDNNNNNVNSDNQTVNEEEVKITDSKTVQEEKEKENLLKLEKEAQHEVNNASTNETLNLATQQSEQAMEELQKEKLIAKSNTSQSDNLHTTADSADVKQQTPEFAHNTPESVAGSNNTKNNNNTTSKNDNSTMTRPILRTGRANITKVITKRRGKEHKLNELHTTVPTHNKEINISTINTTNDSNHIASDNGGTTRNVENSAYPLETMKDAEQLHLQEKQEEQHKGVNANKHEAIPSQEHVKNKIDEHVEMKAENNKEDAKTTAVNESVETNANSLSQESHRLRFFVELDEPSTTSHSAKAEIGAPSAEIHIGNSQNIENMNVTDTHNADLPDQKTSTPVEGTGHRMHKLLDRKRLQSKVTVKEQQEILKQNENVEPIKRVGAVMMKAQAGKLKHRVTTQTSPTTSTPTSSTDVASSQRYLSHIEQEQQKQKIAANHTNEEANTENKHIANGANSETQSTLRQVKLEEVQESTPHSLPTQETNFAVQANAPTSVTVPSPATKVSMTHEDNDEIHTKKSGKKINVNTKRALHSKKRVATKLQHLPKEEQQDAPTSQSIIEKAAKVVEATNVHQPEPHSLHPTHHHHSSPMGYIAAHPDITDVTVINRIRKRQEMERKLRKARRTWQQQQQRNINTSEGDGTSTQAIYEGKEISEENKMSNEISSNSNSNSTDKVDNHTNQMQGKPSLSISEADHIISSESYKHKQKGDEVVEEQISNDIAIHHQEIAPQSEKIDESEINRSMSEEVDNNITSSQEHTEEDATIKVDTDTQANTVNTQQGHEHAPQQMSTRKLTNINVHSQPHTARVMQKVNVKKSKHYNPSHSPQEAHDNADKLCNDKAADTNINIDYNAFQTQNKGSNIENSTTHEAISSTESNSSNTEDTTPTKCTAPEKQEGKEELSLSDEEELQEQHQQQQTSRQNDKLNELPNEEKNDISVNNIEEANVNSTICESNNNTNDVASADAVHITDKETTMKNLTREQKKAKRQLVHSPTRKNKYKRKNRNKHKTVSAKQKEQQSVEITHQPNVETATKLNALIEDHESSSKDKIDLESQSNDAAFKQVKQNDCDVKSELGMRETHQSFSQEEQLQEQQIGEINDMSTSAMNDRNISQANNNNDETLVDEESKEQESKELVAEEEQQEEMENVQMKTHSQHAQKHITEREEEHLPKEEVQNEMWNSNSEVEETVEQLPSTNTPTRKKRFFTELEPSSTLLPELDTQENVKEEELRNVASTNDITDNTILLEQDVHDKINKQQQYQQSLKAKSKTHHTSDKIINEFITSDNNDDANTIITTDGTTYSHTDNKINEIYANNDSHNDVLTQNRCVTESEETLANDQHCNNNKSWFEQVNSEAAIGERSNESSEMALEQNIAWSSRNDGISSTNETESCAEHKVETTLPSSSSSSPHVQSLHEPEAQQETIPFVLRHFPKKIMKMMKLNKKRANVLTAPDYESNNTNAEEHKVQEVESNNDDNDTSRSENSDVNNMHNKESNTFLNVTATSQKQMDDHQGDTTETEVEDTVKVASPIEQDANKESLQSEQQKEQQQEWKELQEQEELEVEKQQKLDQESQECKEQEQHKVAEVNNKEEGDAAVISTNNITSDNIVNTEVSLTPQVLRRLSAKRKIKKHAELAAARRKSKANITSSSLTATTYAKLHNNNEKEEQLLQEEEKHSVVLKDTKNVNKLHAIKNKRIQQETENANDEYIPPPLQQQNEEANNSDAKFLHHKRKSNLKELDALSQIDHLIHCTEENTSMPSHTNTIGATTNNNNSSAGVIDYNNNSDSNSSIIKPASHTSEEMLLNKFALPLPSGNVLLEEFSEKEMLLRRNSLEVPWEVGLRFDWNVRTLALGSFPAFTATDPRSRHPFMSLYHSRPAWYLHEVNGVNATQMKEVMEAMKRSLTARFIFRRV